MATDVSATGLPLTAPRQPLVPAPHAIRLGMLGSSVGNGHPYSWSALFNGYDRELMRKECPFPGIPDYLDKESADTLTIPGATVTHIHCAGSGGFTAEHVARCSRIPHVVERATDLIGAVDAVVIATDIGSEHVERARPFVEAGLPVFIDKPLADTEADLAQFAAWEAAGKPILSSSAMRYAKEFLPWRLSTRDLGELRLVTATTPKSWEAYGIHALEGIYPILGPGFLTIRNTGTADRNVVHITHARGVDGVVVASADMFGGFGLVQLVGTKGRVQTAFADTHFAFKAQLAGFIDWLRTGVAPYPFAETVELMKLVIGGIESRRRGGAEIALADLAP
ncbi:MAG: Gfo/Idh/MocA family protein [Planctomycetia bacterium]